MRKSRILHRSFCDANVCGSQVKAVLLNVIKTLSQVDARFGCSSGQIYGLEGGPWRVPRRKIGSVTVGGKAEYAVRPPEYVHLHCVSHSGRDQEIAHKQRQKSGDVSSCSMHKSRILHQNPVKQFQPVVAVETAPAFLRILDQFEDHRTLSI
jgi:hypothetical protein